MVTRSIDIIVPIYRNASLTEACIRSLLRNLDELRDRSPRLTLINDSPDDEEVIDLLARLEADDPRVVVHTNPANLGFVRSVNFALRIAQCDGRDVLLVNSDTVTFYGTLRELLKAAKADPQIGFVSPRSNNASICSLPHFLGGRQPSPEEALSNWKTISKTLPAFHFSPTCVGFYMFIAHSVLANHGGLREDFGVGYEEENDLVMRASRVGTRAVIANRAFAYHAGAASFSLTALDLDSHRSENLKRLAGIHPEFLPLVRRYEGSAHYRAEQLMSGLLPDSGGRLRLVFDLTGMGQHYNGTNEHTVAVLRDLLERWRSRFRIAGVASREVFRFHALDKLDGLEREDPAAPGMHAVAIRLAQPFDLHHVNVLESLAPINIFAMLDTIAEDCGPLAAAGEFLPLWDYVAEHANGLLFNSQFSERAFCVRHPAALRLPRMTRLLSTRVSEYCKNGIASSSNSHVLVLGNHFPHKGAEAAGRRLAQAFPTIEFVVIGGENARHANLTVFRSGTIESETMDKLIRDASIIVLPAHVEGFGLGLMHGLASRKPIVARRIPATEEILSTLDEVQGVFLFDSDADLVSSFQHAMKVDKSEASYGRAVAWSDWADGVAQLCLQVCEAEDVFPRLVSRIRAGDLQRRAMHAARPANDNAAAPPKPPSDKARMGSLSLSQLLALNGRAFVEGAYATLLCRAADESGLAFYVSEIESGLAKRDVLQALATSPEGRAKGVQLEGLSELVVPSEPARKSLFGRILRN